MYYLEGKEQPPGEGRAQPKDINEAIKWFSLASKSGMFHSTFNLAMIYYEGHGVEKDLKKAEELFGIGLVQDRTNTTCTEYLLETRRLIAKEEQQK